jgi:TetR/AcrR family transcriptional regulator, regulator of cefoperazone and chloramphenicol sensitivity
LEDLTAHARIRNAALAGFARDGVAATSIRDVAKAAGVSPGLVQHYFRSKAALVRAVNDRVIAIAAAAFSAELDSGPQADVFQQVGDRITGLVRDNPLALLYVARSTADGEEAALGIFDAFVTIARGQISAMADQGVIDPGTDLDWLALHSVVYNLGTILFERALNRHLPEPFFTDRQLQRWNEATTTLTRRGSYRSSRGAA